MADLLRLHAPRKACPFLAPCTPLPAGLLPCVSALVRGKAATTDQQHPLPDAWRSFYLSEAVSTRMRALLFADYIRRGLFGRDLSRL